MLLANNLALERAGIRCSVALTFIYPEYIETWHITLYNLYMNTIDTTWIIHGDRDPNPPFGTFALYDEK